MAQEVFARIGFETKSGGVLNNFISESDVDQADKIIVMEQFHKEMIVRIYPRAKEKIVVLGIPDTYCRGNPELGANEFVVELIDRVQLLCPELSLEANIWARGVGK